MEISKSLQLQFKSICLKGLAAAMKFHEEESILLCADPRGGSTWLAEILLQEKGLAMIWEPLHLAHNPLFRKLKFGYRQHIPEQTSWPLAKRAFDKLLSGKNLNLWTTFYCSMRQLTQADRLLIKMCRAGLLLPWLTENYDFKRKPIYLVRHPYAVVASQLRQGSWDNLSKSFNIPHQPFNGIYDQHRLFLEKLSSPAEVLTATWCICNSYLLTHPKNNINWITLTYEHLYCEPLDQLKRIYHIWNSPLPTGIKAHIKVPSKTALSSSPVHDRERQLAQWMDYFKKEDLRSMNEILKYFGIELYNESVLPQVRFS